jgi:hypothetical protein
VRVLVERSSIPGSCDIFRRNIRGSRQGLRGARLEAANDCASSLQLSQHGWLLSQIYSDLLQDFQTHHDLLKKEEKFAWNAERDEAF